MTQKFTTPCFIRKSTEKLRKKLEELGYRLWGAYLNEDLCIFTEPINGLYRIEFFSNIPHPEETDAIDCGTNEDLFLALSALREDTDKGQWFCPYDYYWHNHFFICRYDTIKEHINKITNGDGVSYKEFHKATAEEIIEHFKNK